MVKTIVDKLHKSIDIDNLPGIIVDADEFHDILMDIALECRRCSVELSPKEQQIFNDNNEYIISLVGKKIGLL